MIKVVKFGGSSLADAVQIKKADMLFRLHQESAFLMTPR